MRDNANRLFWWAVLASLAVKIALGLWVPITSDEAYFTLWASHLDFGYYDHPPMIGWILWPLSFLGHATLLLRLPAIFSTILIGLGIRQLLLSRDPAKASLAGTLFLVSPINFLNIFITTDTPLLILAFLSVLALYLAFEKESYLLYLGSGIFLGLAFLSKYFAAFLGLAYLVYYFMSTRERTKALGIPLLLAAALPFVALNLCWNYTHGWTNILFNLINRNQGSTFSPAKAGTFILSQFYLMTPPALYFLVAKRRKPGGQTAPGWGSVRQAKLALFAVAFLAPLAVLLLLSFKKLIGLHWALAFYPFYFILLFALLNERELRASIKFMAYFALLHLAVIAVALSLPTRTFSWNKNYFEIVLGKQPLQVFEQLKPYADDYVLSTPNYADSALLSYHSGRYFAVFGGGSFHGRQDDLITDYSKLEGKNILILRTSDLGPGEYARFFQSLVEKRIDVEGAAFYVVLGRGFHYLAYRDTVLTEIRDRYYAIPPYLPLAHGSFFFRERYFR